MSNKYQSSAPKDYLEISLADKTKFGALVFIYILISVTTSQTNTAANFFKKQTLIIRPNTPCVSMSATCKNLQAF